jgi:hypothetical protein
MNYTICKNVEEDKYLQRLMCQRELSIDLNALFTPFIKECRVSAIEQSAEKSLHNLTGNAPRSIKLKPSWK